MAIAIGIALMPIQTIACHGHRWMGHIATCAQPCVLFEIESAGTSGFAIARTM